MSSVVVGGALANQAGNGGAAWERLSWTRGFEQLGLDVWFVEELDRGNCTDADGAPTAPETSANAAYFREVTCRFGLEDRATLLVGGAALAGPPLEDLLSVASSATLVNLCGHLSNPRLCDAFRSRVLVDTDPGFTQFWHTMGTPGARVEDHDQHFTIAENIGANDCGIPTSGINWRTVRQPVVLSDWPVVDDDDNDDDDNWRTRRFTTVANWRGPFGPVEFDGRTFGLKVHEFRKVIELPSRSHCEFELALNIHPADEADLTALREHGWHVIDPGPVTSEPETFREYVQGSGAEFSVAQGIYVDTGSGWFSDRSTRYLASGRPVLVQDTGFGRSLPVGKGLVAFRTLDEAAAGADRIAADYHAHASAAREIAEQYFGSDRVLSRFCDQARIS